MQDLHNVFADKFQGQIQIFEYVAHGIYDIL